MKRSGLLKADKHSGHVQHHFSDWVARDKTLIPAARCEVAKVTDISKGAGMSLVSKPRFFLTEMAVLLSKALFSSCVSVCGF